MDRMSHEGALYRVDELLIVPLPNGRVRADLELTRMILKRGAQAG